MGLRPQERERGLAVLNETRQTRRRAIVFGRVRVREVATGFWIMTFVGLLIFSFAYYRYTLVELDARRSELLGRQRAVAMAVGMGGFALRDQLEAWVMALAEGRLPEQIAADARLDDIANGPSIYVRLRQADAHDAASIRKGAARSVRDGFTSCLFVGRAEGQQGPPCTLTSQCGPGEVCGDFRVCAAPAHPYNLRLLNEGMRVLEPEWLSALEAATDDLQVRAIGFDLEDVAKHAAVAGAEVVRRSRYFTAVLDEEPTDGATPSATVIPGESAEEQLQALDHPVRVGIWDIQRGVSLAVMRLEAAGRFVRLGSNPARDPLAVRAQQRQANNCSVATEVRGALAAGRVPSASEGAPGTGAPPVAGE
jgi:hypothetical protein